MNAQEIVERIMSAHWELDACGCWVCRMGTELGFAPHGDFLPHHHGNRHLYPVPARGWYPETAER